jgi:hypothetical protein
MSKRSQGSGLNWLRVTEAAPSGREPQDGRRVRRDAANHLAQKDAALDFARSAIEEVLAGRTNPADLEAVLKLIRKARRMPGRAPGEEE